MYKIKKSSATRAFACLLILFMLLAGWAIAETAADAPAEAPAAAEVIREMIQTLEKGEKLDQQKVSYIMELKNEERHSVPRFILVRVTGLEPAWLPTRS